VPQPEPDDDEELLPLLEPPPDEPFAGETFEK
jgi:hypothetical protein